MSNADNKKKSILSNLKKNDNTKKYKKKKSKRDKRKRMVNGKFQMDILDLLIIIVITVTISCVFTGFVLNFQYRKNGKEEASWHEQSGFDF